jgi:hypothetical protein
MNIEINFKLDPKKISKLQESDCTSSPLTNREKQPVFVVSLNNVLSGDEPKMYTISTKLLSFHEWMNHYLKEEVLENSVKPVLEYIKSEIEKSIPNCLKDFATVIIGGLTLFANYIKTSIELIGRLKERTEDIILKLERTLKIVNKHATEAFQTSAEIKESLDNLIKDMKQIDEDVSMEVTKVKDLAMDVMVVLQEKDFPLINRLLMGKSELSGKVGELVKQTKEAIQVTHIFVVLI